MHTLGVITLAAMTLTGCSDLLGIEELSGPTPDAATAIPPPPEDPPALTGVVTQPGGQPVKAATVTFFADNIQPIAMIGAPVVTADNGRFAIPTAGAPAPLDGYFQIDAPGLLRGYAHLALPSPVVPSDQSMLAFSLDDVRRLALAAGTTHVDGTTLVVATIIDPDGTPVEGASVVATMPVCFERDRVPTCSASDTDATGHAWFFSVPATDNFTVSATKNGTTYTTWFPVGADTTILTGVRR